MTDIRKLFDSFNQRTGNKLVCEKLYIVPAMKLWVDYTDSRRPEVLMASFEMGKSPFQIKAIKFNPDITEKEMIRILKNYLSQALVVGNHWSEYVEYKKSL